MKGVGESEVAGDRESEICSVRKDVAGVVVLAGWRRDGWNGDRKVLCSVKKAWRGVLAAAAFFKCLSTSDAG